jgi:poly-gamma-glutamate biosynthesis protein PgsC/CapC
VHDYLLSTEVIRFAFIFGVAVSMLLYERRHLTTGSIVVPGYIASFIVYPMIIVATFINAFISYLIVNKLLRRWFLLYGRTKFTVLAMTSILIQTAMLKLTPSGPWLWESDLKLFVGVGYVVPALIAHDMGRQGIAKTTKSVLLAAAIVATPITLALLLDVPGINDLAPLQGGGNMAIEPAWLPIAVLLSAAASWGVSHNYDFRSGGFVGAAFIGMLMGDPWQVVIAGVIAVITYVIVTRFLMGSMILFGRRKFSAMLLVSSSIAWVLLWVGNELFDAGVQRHLALGSLALTPLFVPGLLANDTQRTSPRRVLFGVTMATSFVTTTTWWIQSLFEGLALAPVWKAVAVLSFASIFWRQFVPSRSEERAETTAGALAPQAEVATRTFGAAIAYGRAGFERWATAHRDAAEQAERWLMLVLGEQPEPVFAVDTRRADTSSAAAPRTLDMERSTERLRRAAIKALSATTTPTSHASSSAVDPPPDVVPDRESGLSDDGPAERPPSGEFDTIATAIAAGVGRPHTVETGRGRPAVGRPTFMLVTPANAMTGTMATLRAADVHPDGTAASNEISEQPGAATRAHTSAAPVARTTLEGVEREENTRHSVLPG